MGVNIRYHLDLCMTGIALNGFHIAAVQLQLVSDTGMSETMENHFTNTTIAGITIYKALTKTHTEKGAEFKVVEY